MSLSLFNKLVNIVNTTQCENRSTDDNDTIKGGMLMTNTIDNLVGGNTVSNACDDKNVITKEFNPNLFEGGAAHAVDTPSYSTFLQRLSTNKLYTSDEQTVVGGGGEQSADTIDILPMFPYLVRYG